MATHPWVQPRIPGNRQPVINRIFFMAFVLSYIITMNTDKCIGGRNNNRINGYDGYKTGIETDFQ
jgi:hypothetical protein